MAPSRIRPHATAALALLAGLSLAATCEGQDYLAPTQLRLEDAPPFEAQVVELEQPYRGRNNVDYAIRNTGDSEAQYGLFAASFCWQSTEDCTEKTASRVVGPVAPGESASGRIGEDELGLGDRLHIEFLCYAEEGTGGAPCSGLLDLLLSLSVVDCVADSDCGANEECNGNLGVCERQGEEDSGCQTAPGPAPSAWVLICLAVVALGRRR